MISALLIAAAMALAVPNDIDACDSSAGREAALALAVQLTARWEGLARCVGPRYDRCAVVTAYPDPGVGYALPTIGYGTTARAASAPVVKFGMVINRDEADALLRAELRVVASRVCAMAAPRVLSPNQLAALSSFAYNLGLGTLQKTREAGLLHHVRAGRDDAASAVMRRYVYAAGRRLPGLAKRRDAEARLYLGAP